VVNPTDSEATLTGAELHVSYSLSNRILVVKIPHNARSADLPDGIVSVNMPTPLQPNGALEDWFVFRLDDGLIGNADIEDYNIVLYDSRGITQSVHTWIIREIPP